MVTKAHHAICRPTVNQSELKAIKHLRLRLSSESGEGKWVFSKNLNLTATRRRQPEEIDVVAIGPSGVQVIEVKHWTESWIKRNPPVVGQEARRVTEKGKVVSSRLRALCKDLPRVNGLFLLTEAPSKVSALESREAAQGIPFYTLKTWKDAIGLHGRPVLSDQQVQACAGALKPVLADAADLSLKRLAGYSWLDLLTPPHQKFHRIYRAVHAAQQDRVLLHLYDHSAGESSRLFISQRPGVDLPMFPCHRNDKSKFVE